MATKAEFIKVTYILAEKYLAESENKSNDSVKQAIALGKAKAYSSVACFFENNDFDPKVK